MMKMPTVSRLDNCWMSRIVFEANTTWSTPERFSNVLPKDSTASTSLFTGSTRNDGGRSSAVMLSINSGESAKRVVNSA